MEVSSELTLLHLNCFAFRKNITALVECLKRQQKAMASVARRLKNINHGSHTILSKAMEDTEITIAALLETV